MCGIFGMVFHSNRHTKVSQTAEALFAALAMYAVERGYDATGFGIVRNDRITHVYRALRASSEAVEDVRWWRASGGLSTPALAIMGHTRWGTHGENTLENTHPFQFTNGTRRLIGTHNGQITNYEEFGPELAFANDSRNLMYGLSRRPESAWPKMLSLVKGSYAVALGLPGRFFLARNGGSPCVLSYCAELDATVYASTPAIMGNAAKGAKVALTTIRELPVGELWRFLPYTTLPEVQDIPMSRKERRGSRWERWSKLTTCYTCDDSVVSLAFRPRWGYVCDRCASAIDRTGVPGDGRYERCFVCKTSYPVYSTSIKWCKLLESFVCRECELHISADSSTELSTKGVE